MEDIIKKFIYTGIGLVSLTRERLQKNIDELVANQKLSREEGRKIVDDVMHKTESKRGEFETQLKKVTEEVMERFNFARSKEVEELKKRVESLEIKLGRVKAKAEKDQVKAEVPETPVQKPPQPSQKKPVKKTTKSK